jgi:16S rRNA G527 N7-methylase RsmG
MSPEPSQVAQRALESLPDPLRENSVVRRAAYRIADELIRYGQGVVEFGPGGRTEAGAIRLICEDLEATYLLAEHLSSQEAEGEELTPAQRMEQILAKATAVKGEIAGGLSLKDAIRRELADTDCGACDHPTCDLYSIALADGSDKDNTKCEPGGPKVTAQVELVMEVGGGKDVDAEKIISIESMAKDDGKREGGLRVLEISTGRGSAGVVFAQVYPDVAFEIIEPDLRRVWFLKRLINLLGIRNCKLRVGGPSDFVEKLGERFDLVFIKHRDTEDAVREGLPFARPGGLIVNWQDENWSEAAARYQRHGLGFRVPLYRPMEFQGASAKGSVLLLVRRPAEAATEAAVRDGSVAV